MKSLLPIFCLLLLAFAACKNSQSTQVTTDPNPPVNTEPTASECKAPQVGEAPESDALMGLEASIADHCLVLKVTYSGGCQPHSYELYWSEMWAESIPPQTGLHLVHHANGDNCRAIKTEEVKFDLSSIRYPGLDEAQLNLFWAGQEERISLSYKY